MSITDPVRAVSVISTGSVENHAEQVYGSIKPLYWWLLTSRRWLPPRPINVYVIEHAKGLVLFDTGQDRASVTDGSYFPGGVTGLVYKRLARFHIDAPEARRFLRAHITIPSLRWKQVEFEPDAGVAPFTESLDVMGDGSLMLRSTDQVLALAERLPGLVVLPAHDPGAARRLIEASA